MEKSSRPDFEVGPVIGKFQKDPVLFFKEALGVETLEEYQAQVLEAIRDNERVAVAACHDVGKSWMFARAVLWFGTCFPYSKIITTAPTYNQVKNILWSEIRAAHAKAKLSLGGRLNQTEWQLSKDGDWFALGFTPRNEVQSGEGQGTQSSFQGFHAPHILIIFDEATGIPHNIWTMAEGLMTSSSVKWAAIGNPTSRNSEFFNCFRSPSWKKVYLSCFDSPNLQAAGIKNESDLTKEIEYVRSLDDVAAQARLQSYPAPRPYLLSTKWVVSNVKKWGASHPLTVSKIFGRFPDESDNTLIPLGRVEDAQLRVYYPQPSDRKIIGVDVARFGSDSTVITALHGKKVLWRKEFTKRDLTQVTGHAIDSARDIQADVIVVDETGLGAGVVDNLREYYRDFTVNVKTPVVKGVQFGAGVDCDGGEECDHKDCSKARYVNLKARMFDLLAQDIKKEDGLTLPNEAIYLEELPTILYAFDSKGRMSIESKEDYKRRTGRGSPDSADSLALANFGRYDEIETARLTDNFTDFAPPLAASLGMRKSW